MKYLSKIIMVISLILGYEQLAMAQDKDNDGFTLPGPYKTSLFLEGELSFENGGKIEDCVTINFVLKYKQSNQIQKQIVDRYENDGGCPQVISVFYYNIRQKPYVFTIVKWDSKHLGVGMNGDDYQVFAYMKNNKTGTLQIDKTILHDEKLQGFEGMQEEKNYYFKYKDAISVKRYLKKVYQGSSVKKNMT